jgi:hypothetical protein
MRSSPAALVLALSLLVPTTSDALGFLDGNALRACLFAGGDVECKAVRVAYVRGAMEGLAMGEQLDRKKQGNDTPGPYWRCYERIGSADQLLSLYEKFEAEHPELWSAPINALLLGALRPLCADLFDAR